MSGRDREEWTEKDERNPEGEPDELMTPDGEDVALGGIDDPDPDADPEIAEEARLLGETEEARLLGETEEADEHEPAGPLEAALDQAEEEDAGGR
jgi:hypothetical protein